MNRLPLIVFTLPLIAADPLRLSLKQAVEMALAPEGHAQVRLVTESVRQAEARSAQARAALLPDVAASVAEQNQTRNLAAFGIRVQLPIPGFAFPELVGPFSTFDVRATATQSIFDLAAVRRYQAARTGIRAARAESESVAEQVAAQVARLYLTAQRCEAVLEATRADLQLSEALLALAESRKAVGTGTGLEVTRARVQLAHNRQRLIEAENARRRAQLELLRALNLDLTTELVLTEELSYRAVDAATLEEARSAALKQRPDLAAQREREQSARLSYSAMRYERLPSLVGFADYGSIGNSIHRALPTRTVGISLRLPVFDGGRRDSRRAESLAQWRQEHIRTEELGREIELGIRLALDDLRAAEEQVKVAADGLQLAENELAQARRRYEAGVAGSLEVTDAQTRLERARENRISALFAHNLARLDLARAMGAVRRAIQ